MICPNCQANNQESAAWCYNCHKPFGAPATETAVAPPPQQDFQYDLGDKKSVYDHEGRMIGAAAGKPVAPKQSRLGLWIGLGVLGVVIVILAVIFAT